MENTAENTGEKLKADPVFFLSLVGVDKWGKVEEHEHLFDIHSKAYDVLGEHVTIKSAQDLFDFYMQRQTPPFNPDLDIYQLTQFFVSQNSHAHFVIDECPFLMSKGSK